MVHHLVTVAVKTKNNKYTSVEDISQLTNIPIQYIALSDFDKKRIQYYLDHFVEYFEKEAINKGGIKTTKNIGNGLECAYMFSDIHVAINFISSFGVNNSNITLYTADTEKNVRVEFADSNPFFTYVVKLFKGVDKPSSTILIVTPDNDIHAVLDSKKEAYDKYINMYERFKKDFKTPYEFIDYFKIFIKFFESTTTLTFHGILDFISRGKQQEYLMKQIGINISKIIESGNITDGYKDDVIMLFSTSNREFTYDINSLLKYYVMQGLTLENFTKFVTGYKFIKDNLNIVPKRDDTLYQGIPFTVYKNNILTQSIDVFCKILPEFSESYINEIVDDLFVKNCGEKRDGIDILPTFTDWLNTFNKINEILDTYNIDTYEINNYITDEINIIKTYFSDVAFLQYMKDNDIDVYDIYNNIKENDANDIDDEKIVTLFKNNIIQPKDELDYALLYKNKLTEYNDTFFEKISNGKLEGEYYMKYNSLQDAADDMFNTKEHEVKIEDFDLFDISYESEWTSYDNELSDKILYFMYYYFIKKGFTFSKKYTPKMLTDKSIWRELNRQIETIIRGDYEADNSEELYNNFDYEQFQSDLSSVLDDCQRSADEGEYYDKNVEKFMEIFEKFNNGQYFKLHEEEVVYYDYDKAIEKGYHIDVKDYGYVKVVKKNNDNTMTISKDGVEHIVSCKILKERIIFKISEDFIKNILEYADIFSTIVYQSGNKFDYNTLISIFKDETGGLEPFTGDYYGNIGGDYNKEDFTEAFLNHEFEGDIDSYWAAFDKKYSKLFK